MQVPKLNPPSQFQLCFLSLHWFTRLEKKTTSAIPSVVSYFQKVGFGLTLPYAGGPGNTRWAPGCSTEPAALNQTVHEKGLDYLLLVPFQKVTFLCKNVFLNLVYTKETSRSYELEGEKNTQQIFSHLIVVPNIYVYIPNEPSWLSMQDRSFLLLRGFWNQPFLMPFLQQPLKQHPGKL